ncbi:hypothetical protein [Hydrogenophaga sp. MI9]|uniref:hypothetical protein n=1 Tax=Hydrogenophaga sp. MI9 TaxID=3453719 RepID=UPI003EE88ADE
MLKFDLCFHLRMAVQVYCLSQVLRRPTWPFAKILAFRPRLKHLFYSLLALSRVANKEFALSSINFRLSYWEKSVEFHFLFHVALKDLKGVRYHEQR